MIFEVLNVANIWFWWLYHWIYHAPNDRKSFSGNPLTISCQGKPLLLWFLCHKGRSPLVHFYCPLLYLPMRCALYSFIPLLLTGKYFTTGPPESPYSRLSTIAIDGVHMPTWQVSTPPTSILSSITLEPLNVNILRFLSYENRGRSLGSNICPPHNSLWVSKFQTWNTSSDKHHDCGRILENK